MRIGKIIGISMMLAVFLCLGSCKGNIEERIYVGKVVDIIPTSQRFSTIVVLENGDKIKLETGQISTGEWIYYYNSGMYGDTYYHGWRK